MGEKQLNKVYKYPPDNIEEIKKYAECDTEKIIEIILRMNECVVYDACTFRFHKNIKDKKQLLTFFVKHGATVIIPSMIVTELSSKNGSFPQKEMEYIAFLKGNNIKVLIVPERTILRLLTSCFGNNSKVQNFLSIAVKEVLPAHSAIREWIREDPHLYDALMRGKETTVEALEERFFEGVRTLKSSGDNMGEIMVAIFVHMIANIPADSQRFYVFTDDKGAVSLLGKTRERHPLGRKKIVPVTTPKLAWVLNRKYGLNSVNSVVEMLKCITSTGIINVLCSGEYDIDHREVSFSVEELAKTIVEDKGFTVLI
ncbi:MAG: hypothetical protein IJ691_00700 [Lachnospiraceae bacterium]|nr:hypothetical protein [Lachnospiraceae bacterium]